MEMKLLRASYENAKFSHNFYALKENERAQKAEMKRKIREEMKNMTKELPLNILIDKDYVARISVNPTDKVEGLTKLIECTTEDELVVLCKNGSSHKVHVKEISFMGTPLGEPDDIISVIVDNGRSRIEPLYVFSTSHGRVILVDRTLTHFIRAKLNIPLREGEEIIFSKEIPKSFYNENVCIMLRTADNKYKKRPLSEFNIKSKISDFYNMFTDNSARTDIIDACIVSKNESTTLIWNNGLDVVYCFGGFKRNISMPDDLEYPKSRGKFVGTNLLQVHGDIITDANPFFNRTDLPKMSRILFDINHLGLNSRIEVKGINDVELVETSTSFRRLMLPQDIVLSDIQIQAYVQTLGKQ